MDTYPLFPSNLHCHTTFCDGKNTAEEMVQTALQLGFRSIGLSGHSYLPFGEYYCMGKQGTLDYMEEVKRLKALYAGQIEVYLGIEADYYTGLSRAQALEMGFDYTVGSVHYVADKEGLHHHCVDNTREDFVQGAQALYAGDMSKFVGNYYDVLRQMLREQQPHILGHADLVVKLNERHQLFDEQSQWYQQLEEDICQSIALAGTIVEVNTGGIARGHRSTAYPSVRMLHLMHSLGVPVTLSSDAHRKDGLDFGFEQAAKDLRAIGFKSVKILLGGVFQDWELP